ncbi:phosphotransferase enzyme family protein [Deinococcus apachensis]|uniref:phosphotransferase enzyme family protein n=1 Tax=Deinococcus apachensis TaxID=309886 RepID=UPI00036A5D67|nr:phosphotransferase [Deinococcus apachensis]
MLGNPLPSPKVLTQVAARYGHTPEALTDLGSFENHVYAFSSPQGERVLRLVHSSHRSERQIRAELHWLSFLAGGGVSVAAPVPDTEGDLLGVWPDGEGGLYFSTAFVRAEGERAKPAELTPGQIRAWGRLLAELHERTQVYQPEDPGGRPTWQDDPYIRDRHEVAAELPVPLDPGILPRFDALVEELAAQPTTPGRFGLVHNDAHPGNFLLQGERITLFDFDDCGHNFYVNDLAMALYYGVWGAGDRETLGAHLWTHLLAGYREVRPLDDTDLALVPTLLKLREVDLYLLIQRKWDLARLSEAQEQMLATYRRNILEDVPYLEFLGAGAVVTASR